MQEASPTLNQEVVATLFEVLLTHEDVTAAIDHALKSYEQSQARFLHDFIHSFIVWLYPGTCGC